MVLMIRQHVTLELAQHRVTALVAVLERQQLVTVGMDQDALMELVAALMEQLVVARSVPLSLR